jgi:hypothetical protein
LCFFIEEQRLKGYFLPESQIFNEESAEMLQPVDQDFKKHLFTLFSLAHNFPIFFNYIFDMRVVEVA